MAEAMAEAMAPGGVDALLRRLSRGAHNNLRRRASTQHSLRMEWEQGPAESFYYSNGDWSNAFHAGDKQFEIAWEDTINRCHLPKR
ncbi:hypothetical protein B0A54_06138 [Friedmanniomyces endolithicus]|uniref:Uncharacterized protein n=1 Tax=Friedmanniomyces endolithicus TaxID=329885 RepID=A0A4U0V3E8_9PEZI|nr:hypothetical protein B0A54_06138 [Friedmanniomyces endolithicus]